MAGVGPAGAHEAVHDAVGGGVAGAHGPLPPPERTREHARPRKRFGVVPHRIKSRQAAEREARQHGAGRVGGGLVPGLGKGQQLAQHKVLVGAGAAAAAVEVGLGGGAVLLGALLVGVNGHQHERPHGPARIQGVEGGRQAQAGQVLPVVEVQHGEGRHAARAGRRQQDAQLHVAPQAGRGQHLAAQAGARGGDGPINNFGKHRTK